MNRFPPLSLRHAILVPLDGSAFAEAAIPVACALAARAGAPVRLVLACPSLGWDPDTDQPIVLGDKTDRMLEAERHAYIEALTTITRQGHPTVRIWCEILHGRTVPAICRHAHEQESRLIVLMTHARTGLARVLTGSTAELLVAHCDTPALLLPAGFEPARDASFRRALVCVGHSDHVPRALELVRPLCVGADAHCTLLHVEPPDHLDAAGQDDGTALDGRLGDAATRLLAARQDAARIWADVNATVLDDASVAHAIADEAARMRADVIVIGRRAGFHPRVLGGLAHRVLTETRTPVLALPEAAELSAAAVAADRGTEDRPHVLVQDR